jgi:adenylyltransferase/sulfurtransferase
LYQNSPDRSPDKPAAGGARILVVGIGALGCPAARLLADSNGGVGLLTLVDPDRIELSNLQRQPLFGDSDIGALKAEVAATKLAVATDCHVHPVCEYLHADNAEQWIGSHDYVVDATDCPRTKFLINDTASRLGVPFSYGGVLRTGGQTMPVIPGESACLRCVFPDLPDVPDEDEAGACSDMGILAPVAGVIGSLQAAHALAHIDGNRFESGCMTIYNLRGERIRRVPFQRREQCSGCSRSGKQSSTEKSLDPLAPSSALSGSAPGADSASARPRRQQTCHS